MARQKSADSAPAQSAAPKKTRWYKNIWQGYQMTRETDPAVTWWMLGTFLGVMAVAVGIGLLWGPSRLGYMIFVGTPVAVLAPMYVLVRRMEAAAYKRIAGQPGAALSALKTIRRGWDFAEEPVAMDMRTQDLVFRGVGRPGVVLVSEGPPQRAARLLEQERKKVNRVLSTVPVATIQCGDADGQVPLRKLARKVSRLRPTLSKQAAAEVTKRLKALGGVRMPVPKGVDPFKVRPDRKGMRGR